MKYLLTAIGFSTRRKRMKRGSVHAVHDRSRESLQRGRKFKCEEYTRLAGLLILMLLNACSRPPDLDAPCKNFGKCCAQQPINEEPLFLTGEK